MWLVFNIIKTKWVHEPKIEKSWDAYLLELLGAPSKASGKPTNLKQYKNVFSKDMLKTYKF